MIIHQATGCPDHDDCPAATIERATYADTDDDGIVHYTARCEVSGAEWSAMNDEEVSRLVLDSTLYDYQHGRYLDTYGNRIDEPLDPNGGKSMNTQWTT